ncbi:hypothetical protein [Roseateles depolymerans]|uniref:Uncharacterized protein n=1 Tax=Roseateles depolymerans TaxID=76731 RepID=A0A0U3N649_9BURK|nr:hypothetical protein [Roseateles depolymerans]ALV07675.1 hypothetical protein RD2015_3216 [Roseateles depolymerans]REG22102.1 hypothetical protein DES44_1245 [Roseateles depolymerans]
MTTDQLVHLLGFTNIDGALVEAIKANGSSVDALSPKRMKETTSDYVSLVDKGVVLSFTPREYYSRDYGEPQGAGPFVMTGVFYYPNGSSEVSAYRGPVPFAKGAVLNRDQALLALGEPEETDEEDGEVYWDLWSVESRLLQVSYRKDLSTAAITVCLPKKD